MLSYFLKSLCSAFAKAIAVGAAAVNAAQFQANLAEWTYSAGQTPGNMRRTVLAGAAATNGPVDHPQS